MDAHGNGVCNVCDKINYPLNDKIDIHRMIGEYDTKHKEGFIQPEIEDLLQIFPNINMDKYNDAMMGNTCIMMGKHIVNYHCDVYRAIICGIEGRDLNIFEWD